MNSHLSGVIVANYLERHFHIAMDTALHSSKDLAVSPFHFHAFAFYRKAHPVGDAPPFQAKSVSDRTSRIASDGRYPLPCYALACASVRTFLPCIRRHRSNYSVQGVMYCTTLCPTLTSVPKECPLSSLDWRNLWWSSWLGP